MTFTGTPPYGGYPDYNNVGSSFDGNQADGVAQELFGLVFEAGKGFSLSRPISARLAFLGEGAGDPNDRTDYVADARGHAAPLWKRRRTWTVRRRDYNGGLDNADPYRHLSETLGTFLPVVATQDAPNGWDVSLTAGDLSQCLKEFLGSGFDAAGYPADYYGGVPAAGSAAVTAPAGAPYGLYSFECSETYTRQLVYAGHVSVDCVLSLSVTIPTGVIRTGKPHFTVKNDSARPAPGTLTLSPVDENHYSITGTGPYAGTGSPPAGYASLDIGLDVDGLDTDPLYFGPKLFLLTVKNPPPNPLDLDENSPPGAAPNFSDPASYIKSLPSPFGYDITRRAFVLIPTDPPHGGAHFQWHCPWPFYVGSYTLYFFPLSSFGPYYRGPATPDEIAVIYRSGGAYTGGDLGRFAPLDPPRPYSYEQGFGYLPPFVGRLDVDITYWGNTPPATPPGLPVDAGDAAQDHATGRTTLVSALAAGSGSAATSTLTAQAWEGWQSLTGAPPRPSAPIRDAAGAPAQGRYPSVWKDSEPGRASLCYQSPLGMILRGTSQDGLETLMPFPLLLFHNADGSPKTGGRPAHIQDPSTGIYYVAAAFTLLDSAGKPTGKEDVLIARVDATDAILPWADGTDQKAVVLGTPAAGRPALVLSRYDPAQPLLLLHGDRKFLGSLGGEFWSEIL